MAGTQKYTHEEIMRRYNFSAIQVAQWETPLQYSLQPSTAPTSRPAFTLRPAAPTYRYVIQGSLNVPEATDDEDSDNVDELESDIVVPKAATTKEQADVPTGILKSTTPVLPEDIAAPEVATHPTIVSIEAEGKSKTKSKGKSRLAWSKSSPRSKGKATRTIEAAFADVRPPPSPEPKLDAVVQTIMQQSPAGMQEAVDRREDETDVAVIEEMSEPIVDLAEAQDEKDPGVGGIVVIPRGELAADETFDTPLIIVEELTIEESAPGQLAVLQEETVEVLQSLGDTADGSAILNALADEGAQVDQILSSPLLPPLDEAAQPTHGKSSGSLPVDTAEIGAIINLPATCTNHDLTPETGAAEPPDLDHVVVVAAQPGDGATALSYTAAEIASNGIIPDDASADHSVDSEDKHVTFAPGTPEPKPTKRKKKINQDLSKNKRRPSFTSMEALKLEMNDPDTTHESVVDLDATEISPEPAADTILVIQALEAVKSKAEAVIIAKTGEKVTTKKASKTVPPAAESGKSKPTAKSASMFAAGGLLAFAGRPKPKPAKKKGDQKNDKPDTRIAEAASEQSAFGLGIDVTQGNSETQADKNEIMVVNVLESTSVEAPLEVSKSIADQIDHNVVPPEGEVGIQGIAMKDDTAAMSAEDAGLNTEHAINEEGYANDDAVAEDKIDESFHETDAIHQAYDTTADEAIDITPTTDIECDTEVVEEVIRHDSGFEEAIDVEEKPSITEIITAMDEHIQVVEQTDIVLEIPALAEAKETADGAFSSPKLAAVDIHRAHAVVTVLSSTEHLTLDSGVVLREVIETPDTPLLELHSVLVEAEDVALESHESLSHEPTTDEHTSMNSQEDVDEKHESCNIESGPYINDTTTVLAPDVAGASSLEDDSAQAVDAEEARSTGDIDMLVVETAADESVSDEAALQTVVNEVVVNKTMVNGAVEEVVSASSEYIDSIPEVTIRTQSPEMGTASSGAAPLGPMSETSPKDEQKTTLSISEVVTPIVQATDMNDLPLSPSISKTSRRYKSDRSERPTSSRKRNDEPSSKKRKDDMKSVYSADGVERSRRDRHSTKDDVDHGRRQEDLLDTRSIVTDEQTRLSREAKRALRRAEEAEEAARVAREQANAIARQDAEARRRRELRTSYRPSTRDSDTARPKASLPGVVESDRGSIRSQVEAKHGTASDEALAGGHDLAEGRARRSERTSGDRTRRSRRTSERTDRRSSTETKASGFFSSFFSGSR